MATCSWNKLFVFLTLVHFSLSKLPGVQKQLKRHGSRLKIVEAKLEFGHDKLSDIAERLLIIESILNDTTLHSVNGVENGDSKQELSSDVTNVCSPICVGSGIRKQLERYESHLKVCEAREERILEAFYQEKILNGRLREEISDMKVVVSRVEKDIAQTVDDIQTIQNNSVTAEKLREHYNNRNMYEVETGIQGFNSTMFDLTQTLNNVEERAAMALKTCEKVESEVQHIISRLPPKSCKELFDHNITESGVYNIYPQEQGAPVSVFCDMETDSDGWTVFQRRTDGSEDFFRRWTDYGQGFGDLDGEFWLGNKLISEMTADCCYELRIDLGDFEGNTGYAKYANFQVMSKATNYTLVIGNYSGNAGDSLRGHSGMAFSTKDRDNDIGGGNCAVSFKGAWWYSACLSSNLNGIYLNGTNSTPGQGISWFHWKNTHAYSLKMTEMKFRKI